MHAYAMVITRTLDSILAKALLIIDQSISESEAEVAAKKPSQYYLYISRGNGAAEKNRTSDPVITNDVLYH